MALLNLDPPQHRLQVRAELSFAVRDGKTRLTRSLAEPPLQVQRALYPDDSLPDMAYLFLLNPTPGIFQGDIQTIHIQAGPGTKTHIATPSATKVHAMPEREARQTLELTLEKGSYLEYLPEPLIPFQGARLTQRTSAQLSPGSMLVMGEIVLPGRVAHGEAFAFDLLDRRLTVAGPEGHPLFHEASRLTSQTLNPLGRGVLSVDFPVMATLLVVAPGQKTGGLEERLRRCLATIGTGGERPMVGLSELPEASGLIVKGLAREARTIKAIFGEMVEITRSHFLGTSPPAQQNHS